MGYLVLAYVVFGGCLGLYAAWLWRMSRAVRRQLRTLERDSSPEAVDAGEAVSNTET